MINNLCYISATDAIQKYKSGELSPVDVMKAVIEQAEKHDDDVKAFSHTFFDDALKQAKDAEVRYKNGTARPLEGIPVAIKDELDHEGKPNTIGSVLMKDNIATTSAVVVKRTLDAGGIVHARTSVPEFCLHVCTWNKVSGVTRNPWNKEFTSGGSSGGAGASLSLGTTTLAIGSDIGGSIRIPASQSGVVGFKPPYGRVPEIPFYNLDTYAHQGPMARTVDDTILLENVMAGPDSSDIASIYPKLILPDSYDDIRGMKIAYTIDFGFRDVDIDVQKNTLDAVSRLRSLGAEVDLVDLGWTAKSDEAAMVHLHFLAGNNLRLNLNNNFAKDQLANLTSYISRFIDDGGKVTIDDFIESKMVEFEMYQALGEVFKSYDALICPTTAMASIPADWDFTKKSLSINGNMYSGLFDMSFAHYFNMLSRCPVLNLPSGFDRNSVPTGIQVVGPTYRDDVVFRIGKSYESAYKLFSNGLFPLV
ncbi:amidase [Pseudomonas sp. S9]|uniref:amidase n=1 Tax=Pseudomonas sp. S9 TaxID=686578 RepID=UPI000255673E|nr:amidase [Pseudomonas sp. S9]